ncbi:MAG: bifunctional 5,10-methylenetetrahydrofolate dehydrogenase/5,10-methenyltetrahydrofolate cyclohydrolase, partial [Candidatus Eremiobacterota bacterium]
MSARILDGRSLAERIQGQVAREVHELGFRPGLAVVLVGAGQADRAHARLKSEACERVGMSCTILDLGELEARRALLELGEDPSVDGVFLQFPMPAGLRHLVPLSKDVDAIHPATLGELATGAEPPFVPATAAGCLSMLDEAGVAMAGTRAVVLGTDHYAAVPTALLLLRRGATVTLTDAVEEAFSADIVVAAAGCLTGPMLKRGAAVLDLGGHLDFESVRPVAGVLSPARGGLGP